MGLVFAGLLLRLGRPCADDAAVEKDLKKLEGEWTVKSEGGSEISYKFKGDKLEVTAPSRSYKMTVKIDPAAKPEKTLDFHIDEGPDDAKGKTSKAIYKFDGDDTLIFCMRPEGDARTSTSRSASSRSSPRSSGRSKPRPSGGEAPAERSCTRDPRPRRMSPPVASFSITDPPVSGPRAHQMSPASLRPAPVCLDTGRSAAPACPVGIGSEWRHGLIWAIPNTMMKVQIPKRLNDIGDVPDDGPDQAAGRFGQGVSRGGPAPRGGRGHRQAAGRGGRRRRGRRHGRRPRPAARGRHDGSRSSCGS